MNGHWAAVYECRAVLAVVTRTRLTRTILSRLARLEASLITNYVVALRPTIKTETKQYLMIGPIFIAAFKKRYGMLEKLRQDGKLTDEKINLD